MWPPVLATGTFGKAQVPVACKRHRKLVPLRVTGTFSKVPVVTDTFLKVPVQVPVNLKATVPVPFTCSFR